MCTWVSASQRQCTFRNLKLVTCRPNILLLLQKNGSWEISSPNFFDRTKILRFWHRCLNKTHCWHLLQNSSDRHEWWTCSQERIPNFGGKPCHATTPINQTSQSTRISCSICPTSPWDRAAPSPQRRVNWPFRPPAMWVEGNMSTGPRESVAIVKLEKDAWIIVIKVKRIDLQWSRHWLIYFS